MTRRKNKNGPLPGQTAPLDNYWVIKQDMEKKGKTLFVQKIFADWCKACGICIAFCPAGVFVEGESSMPLIKNPDACTGCRFCEFHCPDFAITIYERYPDRRKKKDDS
jgi:2-oxoglutarate ferredoxin oxidoreductase subunit delta